MPTVLPPALDYTITEVTVGATTTQLVASNAFRRFLMIQNKSDEAVYIKIGEAAVQDEGIQLSPVASGNVQGQIEFSSGLENLTREAINGICTSGSKTVVVIEGK
jgi:hypothetical protein